MRFRPLLLGIVLALVPGRGSAQFVQYTTPGDFEGPSEARDVAFDRAMQEARWRFGRLLVDPWFGLGNAGYQNNLTELTGDGQPANQVSDFTASLGAGLSTYLPLGSDLVWGVFVLPEYVWYQDLTERRRLNGRYGTGLFGSFGRIGLDLNLARNELPGVLSLEVEEPFNQRSDQARLELTVDLGKGLLFFARGRATEYGSLEDEAAFAALRRLDRDERVYGAGLGFLSQRGLRFGLGVEETESDSMSSNRSNSGSALVFDLSYDAPLLKMAAEVASRSLDPELGSTFVPFEGETGRMSVRTRVSGPVWVELFARQNLSLSLQESVSRIENDRLGAGLSSSLGSRGRFRVFFEQGESTFIETDPGSANRVDDATAYGGGVTLKLGRIALALNATRTKYESSLPENDRTLDRLTSSITVGGSGRRPSLWLR